MATLRHSSPSPRTRWRLPTDTAALLLRHRRRSAAVLQLTTNLGARVIVTAGSDSDLDYCRQLGAERTVNYKTGDIADAICLKRIPVSRCAPIAPLVPNWGRTQPGQEFMHQPFQYLLTGISVRSRKSSRILFLARKMMTRNWASVTPMLRQISVFSCSCR